MSGQNAQAPVGVLAVMDEDRRVLVAKNSTSTMALAIAKHDAARAAVDELIAADRRIAERSHKKAGGGWWMVSNEDMAAMRAALARVGGVK